MQDIKKTINKLIAEVLLESDRQKYFINKASAPADEGVMTEEFLELVAEVSILKNKYPYKALYVFGPAGSGKSYTVQKQMGLDTTSKAGFFTSNPDIEIEAVFPRFEISLTFADATKDPGQKDLETLQQDARRRLQDAMRSQGVYMINIANPILFDTTGEKMEKMTARMKAMVQMGYDVAAFMINVPAETSVSRDMQRARTVGSERVRDISQRYQRDVAMAAQQGGGYAALAGEPNITILGASEGEGGKVTAGVFNNVFCLEKGGCKLPDKASGGVIELNYGDPLPGVDPADLEKGAFAGSSPETEEKKLATIRQQLQAWLEQPVQNPRGQKFLAAMKKLVKLSKGKLGQRLTDVRIAVLTEPEYASDSDLVAAYEEMLALGVPEERDKIDPDALTAALGDKRQKGDDTIRQMTDEPEEEVEEAILSALKEIGQGT